MNEFIMSSVQKQMAWRDRLARLQSHTAETVTAFSAHNPDTVFGGAVTACAIFQLTDRKEVISHV